MSQTTATEPFALRQLTVPKCRFGSTSPFWAFWAMPVVTPIKRPNQRPSSGREGPFSDSCEAKKLVRGGACSGRRAADQPHRTGQAHARAVRIGRQRFAEGGDGGRDDLCRLVTQPAIHGADLGRLKHSLPQPAVGCQLKLSETGLLRARLLSKPACNYVQSVPQARRARKREEALRRYLSVVEHH